MIRLKSKVLKLLYKTLIIMHFLINRRDKVCFKLDQIQMKINYELLFFFERLTENWMQCTIKRFVDA